MTMDAEVYRQLGEHNAEIRSVNEKIEKLDDRMNSIEKKQDLILAKLNSVGGGWKAIVGMGFAISGFITLIRELFEILHK